MTYLDKYPSCLGCPVEKYCGTAVSSIRLCHSYNDATIENSNAHVLTLSNAPSNPEEEYIEQMVCMWDNITD